eukprot:2724514-Rhodomonas_salina.1
MPTQGELSLSHTHTHKHVHTGSCSSSHPRSAPGIQRPCGGGEEAVDGRNRRDSAGAGDERQREKHAVDRAKKKVEEPRRRAGGGHAGRAGEADGEKRVREGGGEAEREGGRECH